jgi:hypothetical protein
LQVRVGGQPINAVALNTPEKVQPWRSSQFDTNANIKMGPSPLSSPAFGSRAATSTRVQRHRVFAYNPCSFWPAHKKRRFAHVCIDDLDFLPRIPCHWEQHHQTTQHRRTPDRRQGTELCLKLHRTAVLQHASSRGASPNQISQQYWAG